MNEFRFIVHVNEMGARNGSSCDHHRFARTLASPHRSYAIVINRDTDGQREEMTMRHFPDDTATICWLDTQFLTIVIPGQEL